MKDWIFSSCFYYKDSLFFQNECGDFAGRYQINQKHLHYEDKININSMGYSNMIEQYFVYKHLVYGVSVSGKQIFVFDMENGGISVIPISANDKGWGNYACVSSEKDIIYIFTKESGKIISINVQSGKIEYGQLPRKCGIGCKCNEDFLLFEEESSNVWIYKTGIKTIKKYRLEELIEDVVYLEAFENRIYAMRGNGDIYIIGYVEDELRIVEKYNVDRNNLMSCLCLSGDYIIELPSEGNICMIDTRDGSIQEYSEYPETFVYVHDGWTRYVGFADIEDFRYYAMRSANHFLVIDKKNFGIHFIKPTYPSEKEIKEYYESRDGIVSEKELSMNKWLELVTCD